MNVGQVEQEGGGNIDTEFVRESLRQHGGLQITAAELKKIFRHAAALIWGCDAKTRSISSSSIR